MSVTTVTTRLLGVFSSTEGTGSSDVVHADTANAFRVENKSRELRQVRLEACPEQHGCYKEGKAPGYKTVSDHLQLDSGLSL